MKHRKTKQRWLLFWFWPFQHESFNGLLTCICLYMSTFWKQEEEIGALLLYDSLTSIVLISKISVSCLLLDLISLHVARTLPLTHYISSSLHCAFCDTCTHLYACPSMVLNIINEYASTRSECGWTKKRETSNGWRFSKSETKFIGTDKCPDDIPLAMRIHWSKTMTSIKIRR